MKFQWGFVGAVAAMAALAGFARLVAWVPTPQTTRPNLLFIVVDTLRADHVSAYGYERPTTPNIDALARDSVVFLDAMSQAPVTIPSVLQIMTGRLLVGRSIPAETATLAELFRDNGYETMAVIDNPMIELRGSQVERGFTHFFANEILDDRATEQHYKTNTPADVITRRAIRWLDARAESNRDSQPFFAWVHYFDPHDPYAPPHPQASPFLGETASKWTGDIRRNPVSKKNAGIVVADTDRQRMLDLYDSEIHYLDQSLGDLFDHLHQTGLYDDTVIVLTSDHGEAFGERGEWMHGRSLHQNQIHVPLLIKPASAAAAHREVSTLVQLVDLVPTLCATFQIACADATNGRNILTETYSEAFTVWNYWILVRDANWKLIANVNGEVHLYDLDADPDEATDLASSQPERVTRMRARQDALFQSAMIHPNALEHSAEQTRRLEALGYIE